MSDHGGTLIEILHTGRVHMAARTPWTNRAPGVDDTPAFLSRFHPKEPFQPAGLMLLFEAHVGYPAGRQILWPLEQLSDIQLVCALCRGSSFSPPDMGGLYCNRGRASGPNYPARWKICG